MLARYITSAVLHIIIGILLVTVPNSPNVLTPLVPTESPTSVPTSNPTTSPTNNPTTKSPTTKSPTKTPTANPTNKPTTAKPTTPTNAPTDQPTTPTNSPTKQPTTPTNSPTEQPTTPTTNHPTLSPTHNPTAAGTVYLYDPTGSYIGSSLGDRTATTAICTASDPGGCSVIHMMLSYTDDAIIDFPSKLGFSANAQVKSLTEVDISNNWYTMFDPSFVTLINALKFAGVYSTNLNYWSGTSTDGTKNTNNCADWTGGSFSKVGLSNLGDTRWISVTSSRPCSEYNSVLCICVRA